MRLLHPSVRDVTASDLFDLYDSDQLGPDPHLRAGFVRSVDGVIAVDGQSAPLGSPADKAAFRALRTVSDAVIVGAGTARDEDYGPVTFSAESAAWRVAHGRAPQAPVVIVSRHGQLSPEAKVLQGPVILAVPSSVQVSLDVDVIRTVDPVELLEALHAKGFRRLLCEGGPSLLTSLVAAGVVNELCLTTAPTLVGEGPRLLGDIPLTQLSLRSLIYDDPGVLLARWTVVRSAGE